MKNTAEKVIFATRIAKSVAAGQTGSIIPLGSGILARQTERRLLKRIKADEHLNWDGANTTTETGFTVSGFAFWSAIQATEIGCFTHRHYILAIAQPDKCRIYALPASLVERKFALPDIELSDSELETYRRIADCITPSPTEYMVRLPRPAKAAVKANRAEWRNEPLNREALGQLLKPHADWLFPVIAAAVDVQIRSFAPCAEVPIFAYNFTSKKPSPQVEQEFCRALTALNLTIEGNACNSAPPEIIARDSSDLDDWAGCRDRLILLRTATGAPLKPLFDDLDKCERQNCFGGVLPRRLATVPIIRSRTIFDRADTVDIDLPTTIRLLNGADLDLLRVAISRTLTRANAAEVHRRWYSQMHSRARYILNSFTVWRNVLIQAFLEANFPSHSAGQAAAYDGWETSQECQLRAEENREKTLRKALELLGDTTRFDNEIIQKPATVEEATRLLDDEQSAVAFCHTPTQGPDQGRHFIVFSNGSLLRLLKRAGMSDSLYEATKKRAANIGLLVKQSKPVKLGQDTFNGFWILGKKC